MLPSLRPRRPLLPLPSLRLLSYASTGRRAAGDGDEAASAAAAAAAAAESDLRREAYKQVQNLDFTTAAKILFTVPPKRKKFGLDFHLVQFFFACMPSLAVYLVAQYARHEIRRMEAELEEKKKKEEELEKAKQLELESVEEDTDSKLSKVLVRLDTLEETVKEIVDDKRKISSPNSSTKQEVLKKKEILSSDKISDSKSNVTSQLATIRSKDTTCITNPPVHTKREGNPKGNGEKASGEPKT